MKKGIAARSALFAGTAVVFAGVLATVGYLALGPRPPLPALEPIRFTQLGPGIHQVEAPLPSGDTLRYTILVPPDYHASKPVALVVVLHYGGEVTPFYGKEMIDGLAGPALADLGAIIVAPDSLGSNWTSRKNEQAVVWLAQSIITSYAIDTRKVLLTGYSMGGEGTWFIAGRHQELFTAAIPIAGSLASDSNCKTPAYVIHSQNDEVLPIAPVRQYVQTLKARGVAVEWTELTGLTHFQTFDYVDALRDAVPWLMQVWH